MTASIDIKDNENGNVLFFSTSVETYLLKIRRREHCRFYCLQRNVPTHSIDIQTDRQTYRELRYVDDGWINHCNGGTGGRVVEPDGIRERRNIGTV